MKEITEDKGRIRPVIEGDFQCDENGNSTRFYEILSIIGYVKDDGTKIGYISKTDVPIGIPITDTNYWYPFQVITMPKGDKGDKGDDGKSAYELYIENGGTITPIEAWLASLQGKDGKDGKNGQPLMLRVTPDGQSLEISDDGGHTWYIFEKNFSKLRILGYLNSVSELPRNSNIGDIYGVKLPNEEVEPGHSAYELFINTVKGWNEDYTITKIYDYDTELPSYAANDSTVVVPVKYLTLDKQKIDGYKVYRFDQDKNGWTMILNTAEIFASKEDIVNHGDNVYALVQGDSKKTYHDITNWINGSLDKNNKYQEDLTSIIGTCPIDGSVRELSYNVADGYKADIRILSDAQLTPADIGNPTIIYDTEVVEGIGSITVPANAKSVIVTMKSVNEEEEIPTSAGTMVSIYSVKEEKIILYKRDTGWVYFGTNNSITYILVQNVEDGAEGNILSGKAIKDKFDEVEQSLDTFKEEVKETYGDYYENKEFVRVVLDNNKKVLYGVQSNGNFFFGAGCPSQIIEVVEQERARAIAAESTLDETKLDKVVGKSLIDDEYIKEIENPEFIRFYLDNNKKILWGITVKGDIFYGAGVPKQIIDYIEHRISDLSLDEYEDIVNFLDGLEYNDKTLRQLLDEKLEAITVDNPEYIRAITDSVSKVLIGITSDGTFNVKRNLKVEGNTELKGSINMATEELESVNNPEFIKVTKDAKGKIIDGIKKDGSHYIHNVQSESIDAIKDGVNKQKLKISTVKRISILGDSISTFDKVGFKINGYLMYYPTLIDRGSDVVSVEDTWWKQVINSQGAIIEINASYSGSTASTLSVGFSSRVSLLGNPDVIYIALGTNDSANNVEIGGINFDTDIYDLSKFAPAYIKGIKDTIAMYPNAEIICVAFDMGIAYQEAIQTIAKHYNLKYIYVGDISDVHPDKAEMKAVADVINDKLSVIKEIYNPEYLETTTDSEDKIISGRKKNGVAFENVGIESKKIITNSLNLTEDGMTEFQQALKNAGFNPGGTGDWSDYLSNDGDNPLCIPEPRCAIVNLITNENLGNLTKENSAGAIEGVTYNIPTIMEFHDMNGNYFKKPVWISGQGRTSLLFPKKNISLDMFDSEFDGDAFAVRFGDWVAQDSFHLKGYWSDAFRGMDIAAYKVYHEMVKTLGVENDRPYKHLFAQEYVTNLNGGKGKVKESFNNSAICTPMGFPVIVYQNGEFWGIFSWQLKKHRDNYYMSKSNPKHIHLDLEDGNPIAGVVNYKSAEIRNPKNLVYAEKHDGTYKYDADGAGLFEIAGNPDGSTTYADWSAGSYQIGDIRRYSGHLFMNTVANNTAEPIIDAVNKRNTDAEPDFKNKTGCGWLNVTNTVKVKQSYIGFANKAATALGMVGHSTQEEIKKYLESFLQIPFVIDYIIFNNILANIDAWGGNGQWTTWDGGDTWVPNPYDLNASFGYNPQGLITVDAPNNIYGQYVSNIYGLVINTYIADIKLRYKSLRDKGIISAENVYKYFNEWILRIGIDNFDKEFTKWNTSICYRDNGLNEDYWEKATGIISTGWNAETTFAKNTFVYHLDSNKYYRSLVNNNVGHNPATSPEYWKDAEYKNNKTYNVGDYAIPIIGNSRGNIAFRCIQSCTGECPVTVLYSDSQYNTWGYYDSIFRLNKWVKERISYLDTDFDYSN